MTAACAIALELAREHFAIFRTSTEDYAARQSLQDGRPLNDPTEPV